MNIVYNIFSNIDHQCEIESIKILTDNIKNGTIRRYKHTKDSNDKALFLLEIEPLYLTRDITYLLDNLDLSNTEMRRFVQNLSESTRPNTLYVKDNECFMSSGTHKVKLDKNMFINLKVLYLELILHCNTQLYQNITNTLKPTFSFVKKHKTKSDKYNMIFNDDILFSVSINGSNIIIYDGDEKIKLDNIIQIYQYYYGKINSTMRSRVKSARK